MRKRTVCAMALGQSENMQGGIRCFSLATGQILRRSLNDITLTKWTEESLRRMRYINKKQLKDYSLVTVKEILSPQHFLTLILQGFLTEIDAFEHDVYNPHDSNDTESVDEIDAVDDDDTYAPSNREEEDYIEEDLVTAEDDDNNSPDINESEDNSMINSDNNANC